MLPRRMPRFSIRRIILLFICGVMTLGAYKLLLLPAGQLPLPLSQPFSGSYEFPWPSPSTSPSPSSATQPSSNFPPLSDTSQHHDQHDLAVHSSTIFAPGVTKPGGAFANYTRTLVITRTQSENVTWLSEELPDLPTAIYVADDPTAPLHPPLNKGHEVMNYLTYIIDHYDNLPEVIMFMHAHRYSYHNNEIQELDAVRMLRDLNPARVIREGYMNLRCGWGPWGCPAYLRPTSSTPDKYRLQEIIVAQWPLLFPYDDIPDILAQPCCAQFAVSRQRIHAIPRTRFVFYRDWLLRTDLTDYYSGRIWEYLWQYIFTGKGEVCPEEWKCYCDGFGWCFGGKRGYDDWVGLNLKRMDAERQLKEWEDGKMKWEGYVRETKNGGSGVRSGGGHDGDENGNGGKEAENGKEGGGKGGGDNKEGSVEKPETGKDVYWRGQIEALSAEIKNRKRIAQRRGRDPKIRAAELGEIE
ncbi:MAG: E3 ubiquitin-protein ligase hrd1 [Watsoniomyces obsoletus]|nr:MAG: E3 ubiquitin-protein ligase hrd1 [Watsoniomyces obsoletus]